MCTGLTILTFQTQEGENMATLQTKNKQYHHRLALEKLLIRHTFIFRRILSGRILTQEMPHQGPKDKGCTRREYRRQGCPESLVH